MSLEKAKPGRREGSSGPGEQKEAQMALKRGFKEGIWGGRLTQSASQEVGKEVGIPARREATVRENPIRKALAKGRHPRTKR